MVLRYLATFSAEWYVSVVQGRWSLKVVTGQIEDGSTPENKLYGI